MSSTGREHPLRPPVPEDAWAIGEVHVRAWQQAYRGGLMPDAYLDGLSVEQRAEMWSGPLSREPRPGFLRLVVEGASGEVMGFVFAGPAGGEAESVDGEVFALNVEPGAWGQGYGRALLEGAETALRDAGFAEAVLWAHSGNERARAFYERAGWADDGAERLEEVLGAEVSEVRYRKELGR